MAGNKTVIKNRIKSINATKKITSAMKLVSSVKLQRNKTRMQKNKVYADTIKNTISEMLSGEVDVDNTYLSTKKAPIKMFFIFGSDMGLCGGYNINLLKKIEEVVDKKDVILLFGTKLYAGLIKKGYNIINKCKESEAINYLELKKYIDQALEKYKNDEFNSINVIYTKLVNSVTFEPICEKVLPCQMEEKKEKHREILFEPSKEEILNDLIPMMVENDIYARYLEAKTSEYGSRRFAMENATDNANELTNDLLLAYNQARQAAITQEITEIVSGSDAL